MRAHVILLAMAVAGARPALGQGQPLSLGVTYTDVTEAAGIRFQHSFGDEEMSTILEATGSGCMFFDYDNDGWMDLYVVNGAYLEDVNDPPAVPGALDSLTSRLYRNQGDGTFVDVTARSGAGSRGYGMGCINGDYDNDGDSDIYITNYGRNTLLRNNGDGTFTDVTERAKVGDQRWGVGAAFFDMDNDGDLDLYVGNYLEFDPEYRLYYSAELFPGPLAYPGQPDVLYRNEGDGTFTDVTAAAGVTNEGRAMGLMAADFNDDGWTDIYVANDAMEDFLYINQRDGTFVDAALELGVAFSANGDGSSSMGADLGDYDQDGDLDLRVPDMAYNNLFMRLSADRFEDRTAVTGIAEASGQYVSWDGDFLDFDNDGDLDIFLSNGDAHHLHDTMEPLLLANEPASGQGRRFRDVSRLAGPGFFRRCTSRGAAAGDFDNDGDLDLFIVNLDQPSVLLRNDGGNRGHWLELRLRGRRSNPDAVGARVCVYAQDLTQVSQAFNGAGFLSQDDPRLHFGLGARTRVDSVTVRWPGAQVQRLVDIPADRLVEVVEEGE
jgi:enediyne biosynthesis protein E4